MRCARAAPSNSERGYTRRVNTHSYEWSVKQGPTASPPWALRVVWHAKQRNVDAFPVAELPVGATCVVGRAAAPWSRGSLASLQGVSDRHATLVGCADGVRVTDHSHNGTLVDGVLLSGDTDRASTIAADNAVVSLPGCHVVVEAGPARPVTRLGRLSSCGDWLARVEAFVTGWTRDDRLVLLGETGTGKSAVARAAHDRRDPNSPFHRLQLGSLDRGVWKPEVFGWAKGVWNQSTEEGKGAFGTAAGGTLFLDELGHVSRDLLPDLLTALDKGGTYHRMGEQHHARTLDAHVVAAADRDLREDFLAPLWHRLAGCVVHIPPLRARRSDILLLIGRRDRPLSHRTARKLLLYPWPGNVRQLERVAQALGDRPDERVDAVLAAEGAAAPPAASRRRTELPDSAALAAEVEAGRTQAELARKYDVARSTISRAIRRG